MAKEKKAGPEIMKARAIVKAQLKLLTKKSITFCMDLIEFDGSARVYPSSAAQLAWFAYLYRQIKTAPHEVVDAFLESGRVTRDESLLIRQLRAAKGIEEKKEGG